MPSSCQLPPTSCQPFILAQINLSVIATVLPLFCQILNFNLVFCEFFSFAGRKYTKTETWSTPSPLIISVARSVKRVSLPSSASLFRAHGGISALFRCRFSAADSRSGLMLFPADFLGDLRVRARMGNFADFPDLICGSLFPGCHLTFSTAIFTRIFPFGPFRAGMGHLHGMPAAAPAWIEATRDRRRPRSTPARQHASKEPTPAARLQPAQKEPRTGDNARRIGRTSPAADQDAEQPQEAPPALILGKCTQEGPQRSHTARFYCFPVSLPPAATNAAEGHTRGRLTSGTSPGFQKILFRRTSPGDAARG